MREAGSYIPRHKFGAKRTECDGIKFASKKEAQYYQELLLRQKAGEVIFFLRQIPFTLPGGVRYVCDFQLFLLSGDVQFVDVKGMKTKEYIAKKKMVEAIYPVQIWEV